MVSKEFPGNLGGVQKRLPCNFSKDKGGFYENRDFQR